MTVCIGSRWRSATHYVGPQFRAKDQRPMQGYSPECAYPLTDHCCAYAKRWEGDEKNPMDRWCRRSNECLWHRCELATPNEFVAVTSTNTAKIFNIHPRKGAIEVGADADIVVWDPDATRTISAKTHHQNIDFNIYEGMEVSGVAAATISQGKVVWQDGEMKSVMGAGKHIDRPCFPSYYDAIRRARELEEPTPVIRD